ncbi:MAG: hypothetical protein JNJ88_15030 [Planctomycetes bacterium]|nr:hypothetical protein [Planctomycetota bacterium]
MAADRPRSPIAKLLASLIFFLLLVLGPLEWFLHWKLHEGKVGRDAAPEAYFSALGVHPSDQPLPPRETGPKGALRFVVLGDSTAVGFPYSLFLPPRGGRPAPDGTPPTSPTNLSFGAFLAEGLAAATGKNIDLLGFTIQGRSSVGVLADLEPAFDLEPDLLIVYIGHNELAHRIANIGPFGRARHGGLDGLFPGWVDLLRGLRTGARQREGARLDGMPRAFPSELSQAAKFLALGNPEARLPEDLPVEPREVELHLDRYEKNLKQIAESARERGIPCVFVEPTSSLLSAPLSSGKLYAPRAQQLWEQGMAVRGSDPVRARTLLVEARDLDPAPIRLTTAARERLRRAVGKAAIAIEGDGLEERFVDPVHPRPALAADLAERLALALPFEKLPRLRAGEAAPLERFRLACRSMLEDRAEIRQAVKLGDATGTMLAAYLHLQYGNRAAAESELAIVPEADRDFRMTLLMDLALRWRGAREDANAILDRTSARHPDWAESIAWWRLRADR